MKKALLLLLVIQALTFRINAQLVLVPNTATFKLDTVVDAIRFHSNAVTGDLSSCFANAVSQFFDPAYNTDSYAPANSLLRFRNYGAKNSQTFTTSSSWTAPAGTSSVVVLCWGPGGSGGCGLTTTDYYGGGGGGGGAFIKAIMTVTAGNSYSYTVGTGGVGTSNGANGNAGNSSTNFTAGTQYIAANPGQGGLSYNNGRTGGAGGGSVINGITPLTTYNGTAGATAPLGGNYAGGGAGGSGSTGNGSAPNGSSGGSSTIYGGGPGGAGATGASQNGSGGGASGGGGGGSTKLGISGEGGNGKIIIYY